MQLKSFRVQKYRNIEDSGEVELLDALTCVVGKNQAGKSALLRALHKFNPHRPEPYDMRREWPRGQRTRTQTINRSFARCISYSHQKKWKHLARSPARPLNGTEVVVTRDYARNFEIQFPKDPTLFPDALHPNSIDSICQNLPRLTEEVGENFQLAATECAREATQCAREGRFEKLASVRDQHVAALQEQFTEGNPEPQYSNENQFITDYAAKLTEVEAKLGEELTQYQKVHASIVSRLPTFIYMDDYKTFHGRADLAAIKERQNSTKLRLSEEDETLLMILKLSGLDLDDLIKQGKSKEQDIIHDRQVDLQDASTTLTNVVAGRWDQNDYQVQFRVDGQVFFTEIEETKKNIGMIPLEEQSKGFQWFFSFDLHFMHESDGIFEGCVLLLDEPGLHLHPGGQADLLKRLDAYAKKNTLIYTTHLPFLVDLREPERIKVINQTESGAVVSNDLGGTQIDERLTLQAALGMRANQSYLVSERNLLVEGVHDYWIVATLSNIFEREGSRLPTGRRLDHGSWWGVGRSFLLLRL